LGWCAALSAEWLRWFEAASASRSALAGLLDASRQPGVREIVLANGPAEVAGGSVEGDWSRALALSGGRDVPVRVAVSLRYEHTADDAVDGPIAVSAGGDVLVRLAPGDGAFEGVNGIRTGRDGESEPWGRVGREGDRLSVTIHRDDAAGRAAVLWHGGRFE